MNPPTELIDDLRLLDAPESAHWPYGAIIAGLAILAVIGWIIRARRAKRPAQAGATAPWDAHASALAELNRLFALIDAEKSRPYAIESSAIIRSYIEVRFALAAPKRSTEEFLLDARRSPNLAPHFQSLLAEFLHCCDLLKFARTQASRRELAQLHDSAVRFVQETPPAAP